MSEYGGTYEPQRNPSSQAPKPKKKRHVLRTVALIVGGLFALGIVAAVLTPGTPAKDAATPVGVTSKAGAPAITAPTTAAKPTREAHSPAPKPTKTATTEAAPTEAAPAMTRGQEQAIGKAEEYLSFKAFSRAGLIEQLSSEYGSGFSKADATYAVDHITVDWNEQAAKAALEYLAVTHFSRAGLIEQLESSFGSGFTHAQAVYGVTKAGL